MTARQDRAATPLGSEGSELGVAVVRPGSSERVDTALKWGLPLAALSLLLGYWTWVTTTGRISPLLVPTPMDTLSTFVTIYAPGGLAWYHLRVTLIEAIGGFLLGAAVAIVLASLAAVSVNFKRTVYPFVIALQVTPRIAVAPIIIAALGFGIFPKVVLAAIICFFPILINMLTGLLSVPQSVEEMFRSLGSSKAAYFRAAMLPSALPYLMPGLLIGISFALIGAIVGEFISGSAGLGFLIKSFSFLLNMAGSYAVLFSLTIMGLVLFAGMTLVSRIVLFWEHERGLTLRSAQKARRSKV